MTDAKQKAGQTPHSDALPEITLEEFFEKQPRGAQAAMAKALKTSKGYLSELSSRPKPPAEPVFCSGRFAARLAAYVAAKGYALRTGPLCGLEEA